MSSDVSELPLDGPFSLVLTKEAYQLVSDVMQTYQLKYRIDFETERLNREFQALASSHHLTSSGRDKDREAVFGLSTKLIELGHKDAAVALVSRFLESRPNYSDDVVRIILER